MNKCSMMRRKDWSQFWRCVQVQNGWNIQSYLPNALIRGKIIGPLEIHVVQNCHFKFHLSFLTKTYVTYYIWKHSLVRCLYHASTASCSARSKKKSEQEHEGWLSCHGHYILLITVERHNQNHVSRRIKYFFLIPRINILENHASNKITIYEKRQAISHFTRIWAHSRITKIPFTTLVKVRQLINIS